MTAEITMTMTIEECESLIEAAVWGFNLEPGWVVPDIRVYRKEAAREAHKERLYLWKERARKKVNKARRFQ